MSNRLDAFDDLLRGMDFEFFGSGRHKITAEQLLSQADAVLLDIRSIQEVQTLALPFSHDLTTLHIPTDEIPDRLDEIPRDRPVNLVCSTATRAAIVYAYLRIMGFEHVRIVAGGYGGLTEQAKPGKLLKRLSARGGQS